MCLGRLSLSVYLAWLQGQAHTHQQGSLHAARPRRACCTPRCCATTTCWAATARPAAPSPLTAASASPASWWVGGWVGSAIKSRGGGGAAGRRGRTLSLTFGPGAASFQPGAALRAVLVPARPKNRQGWFDPLSRRHSLAPAAGLWAPIEAAWACLPPALVHSSFLVGNISLRLWLGTPPPPVPPCEDEVCTEPQSRVHIQVW